MKKDLQNFLKVFKLYFLYSDGLTPQWRLNARVKQDIDSNPTASDISVMLLFVLLNRYCEWFMRA